MRRVRCVGHKAASTLDSPLVRLYSSFVINILVQATLNTKE